MVLAALVGFSRGLFGRTAKGAASRQRASVGERGRDADKPSEIPAKGWADIILRLYDGFQNDRILLVAAGVTFYGLLALFPATAAIVSLYGLFADATTINGHISLISGFLPDGAIAVIGDQVKRIAGHAQSTLGFTFLGTLALSLWGANAGTKAIFDALNIIYKEREKRSFLQLTLRSLLFTVAGMALALVAMAGVVAVPLVLKILGIPGEFGRGSPHPPALADPLSCASAGIGLPLSLRAQPHPAAMALGDLGQCHIRRNLDRGLPCAVLVRQQLRHL